MLAIYLSIQTTRTAQNTVNFYIVFCKNWPQYLGYYIESDYNETHPEMQKLKCHNF